MSIIAFTKKKTLTSLIAFCPRCSIVVFIDCLDLNTLVKFYFVNMGLDLSVICTDKKRRQESLFVFCKLAAITVSHHLNSSGGGKQLKFSGCKVGNSPVQ